MEGKGRGGLKTDGALCEEGGEQGKEEWHGREGEGRGIVWKRRVGVGEEAKEGKGKDALRGSPTPSVD